MTGLAKSTIAPDARLDRVLSFADLNAAIKAAGLDPDAASPIRMPAGAAEATDSIALEERELDALRILARPRRRLRVTTPGVLSCRIAHFFASDDGAYVGCWREGQGLRLSAPWSPSDFANAAADIVDGGAPMPPDPFRADLSLAGLYALGALVDCLHAAELSSLLARKGAAEMRLSEQDLLTQLALGSSAEDARWMVTLLRLTEPAGVKLPDAALVTGLRDLEAAGLIQGGAGAFAPTDAALRLAAYWSPPLPAIAHDLQSFDDGGAVVRQRGLLAVGAGGPLFVVTLEGLRRPEPHAAIGSVMIDDYRAILFRMLDAKETPRPPKAAETPAPAARSPRLCPACRAEIAAEWKFCKACGAPLHK
jgi:hypothetical protein